MGMGIFEIASLRCARSHCLPACLAWLLLPFLPFLFVRHVVDMLKYLLNEELRSQHA